MLIEFKTLINLPDNKSNEEIVENCKMILHDAVGMLTMDDLTIHDEIKDDMKRGKEYRLEDILAEITDIKERLKKVESRIPI